MKRSFLPLFAAGLSLAVLLSGCGASSGNASQATASAAAYQEMPAATETAVDYSAGFYDAAAPAAENYDMDFGSEPPLQAAKALRSRRPTHSAKLSGTPI